MRWSLSVTLLEKKPKGVKNVYILGMWQVQKSENTILEIQKGQIVSFKIQCYFRCRFSQLLQMGECPEVPIWHVWKVYEFGSNRIRKYGKCVQYGQWIPKMEMVVTLWHNCCHHILLWYTVFHCSPVRRFPAGDWCVLIGTVVFVVGQICPEVNVIAL